ncbi:MAG: hypothetical protein ING87_00485 [Rhodocyclaceae bacterium]|jgi:hypothetical protein|nr:hypothetical protein [Rhodocyclaceae bacterium]
MRKDARDHRGVLDARHDLQPRPATPTAFDLDAEHPLQTLRPAQRHMAGQARLLRCPRDADLAVRRAHLRLILERRAEKTTDVDWDEVAMAGRNDPGVKSVTAIFNHYKR